MTRIDKEALKAKKEAQRAIQYPRIPAVPEPAPAVVKSKIKKTKKRTAKKK